MRSARALFVSACFVLLLRCAGLTISKTAKEKAAPSGLLSWLQRGFTGVSEVAEEAVSVNKTEQRIERRIERKTPRVFVSVLTARNHYARRKAFREAWTTANLGTKYKLKFTVCISKDAVTSRLNNESAVHKDLLFVRCTEGSGWGMLAQKSVAAMKVFDGFFSRHFQMFMQVEDDTFVAWRRVRKFLADQNRHWHKRHRGLSINCAYMGVQTPERRLVERNPASKEYQPSDIYAAETYPIYMQRLGYVLGKDVVHAIIQQGVADARPMSNPDSAIGVWVDMVKKRKVPVRFVKMPGPLMELPTHDETYMCGKWKEYPYLLQHGLSEQERLCLTRIDKANAADNSVANCFNLCQKELLDP